MAKYRGKHNGETRGPYQRTVLWHTSRSEIKNHELYREIKHFLCDSGYSIDECECEDKDVLTGRLVYTHSFYTAHVAGATIGLTAMDYPRKPYDDSTVPLHHIELRLISNDSLDDVVKRITERFPVFKELEPDEANKYF